MDREHGGEQVKISPVKATAVMVTVAVAGGIIVFAASQWFFGQPAPATEILTVTGYDATGGDCLQDHVGTPILECAVGAEATHGGLAAGDAVAIYVYNAGTDQVQITLVEIAETIHLPDASGTTALANGRFTLLSPASGETGVEGGSSKTIFVRYGGADIDSESRFTVIVEAGGQIFTLPVVAGERSSTH